MEEGVGLDGFVSALGEKVLRFFAALFGALLKPAALCGRFLKRLFLSAAAALRAAASRREPAENRAVRRPRAPSSGKNAGAASGGRRKVTLWILPAAAALLAVVTVVHFASLRTALRIDAGQTLIGYAAAESDYLAARSAAEARIRCGGSGFEGGLPEVTYRVEQIRVSGYTTQSQMTDRLLACARGEMTEACGVYVDGRFVGAARSESEAQALFDGVLTEAGETAGAGASCYFGETVSYVPGLYPDTPACIRTEAELRSAARALTVMTTRTETVNEPVGFSVVEIPSRTLSVNTARTILEGEDGVDQVTSIVTYADGQKVSSREVSRVTVVQPIAMRRLVGTKVYSMPVVKQMASVSQLLWPVDGAYNINSDYSYRWGKFHYGLDIGVGSAPGTSLGMNVLAAADGVVELATTHSSYGYYIILDHGNGMETVYGHLLVIVLGTNP